jgi:hypothetical protein
MGARQGVAGGVPPAVRVHARVGNNHLSRRPLLGSRRYRGHGADVFHTRFDGLLLERQKKFTVEKNPTTTSCCTLEQPLSTVKAHGTNSAVTDLRFFGSPSAPASHLVCPTFFVVDFFLHKKIGKKRLTTHATEL